MLPWLTEDPQRLRAQVLALAGLLQAVASVRNIAREGSLDAPCFDTAVDSVLRVDADSPRQVFGDETQLRVGLAALDSQLASRRTDADNETARYAAGALLLARELMRHRDATTRLRAELERIERLHTASRRSARDATESVTSDSIVDELAEIYRDYVGNTGPRIMVYGDPAVLEQPLHAARVRVLLLAAVRAAVLWRQLRGSRLKLLLNRRQVRTLTREMLAEMG